VNLKPEGVETNLDPKNRIASWNIGVAIWLRRTFYCRFEEKLGKTYSSLFTFLLSAFWHGFYPSYYFAFVVWYCLLEV
jgi:lysophospholipid acyltransferase